MSILGSIGQGVGSILGGIGGGLEKGANLFGLSTVDPRYQMFMMQQKQMQEEMEKQRKMEALQRGQQNIFLQDVQSQRSPIREMDPIGVFAKAQQSGFDPNMAGTFANMLQKPDAPAPMSPLAKLMQDRQNIASMNPEDPRLAQLDAYIQQEVNPPTQGGDEGGIGQFNPRDYTTESFARFMQSRNPSDLVRFDPPSDLPTFIGQAALESSTKADSAFMSSREYNQLADELVLNAPTLTSGTRGSGMEFLKRVTGNEDYDTLLRKKYQELRVSSAINDLPPGVASDKDIELVMSKTLDTYANPETVAQYLRGLSKAAKIEGEYNQFRADYLYKNGNAQGMNQAWKLYAEKNAESWGLAPNNDPPSIPAGGGWNVQEVK